MKNRSVVSAAKRLPDLLQTLPGHFPAQVHRHHSRKSNVSGTTLARHICDPEIVAFGHAPLDQLDCHDGLRFLLDEVLQEFFDLRRGDMAIVQGSPCRHAVESAF